MGMFWGWLMGKPQTTLLRMLKNREDKIAKLQDEIVQINKAIANQYNND